MEGFKEQLETQEEKLYHWKDNNPYPNWVQGDGTQGNLVQGQSSSNKMHDNKSQVTSSITPILRKRKDFICRKSYPHTVQEESEKLQRKELSSKG